MFNRLFKIFGFIIFGLSLYGGWLWQSYQHFVTTPVIFEETSVDFVIPSGSPVSSIAQSLQENHLIDDASLFLWMVKIEGKATEIKAGEYQIPSGITPKALLLLFTSGKVKQYTFTIIEGWSFKQLMSAIGSSSDIQHLLKNKSSEEIMSSIGKAGIHPEGRFLPDTYYFPSGTTDIAFLKRAFSTMEKALNKAWNTRDENLPLKTPYEALILASIIEKETGAAHERNQIAGVFIRRLNKKMRLQTDPTVIYGMGDRYKGNIRKKDLRADTPYNTYRIKGLPPTPIAMPGEAAIIAALHPTDDKALYFVAKGDGSHYFSETFAEHKKAVRKYQISQRKTNYRSSPEKIQ